MKILNRIKYLLAASVVLAAAPLHTVSSAYSATMPQSDFRFGQAGTIVWDHAKTNPIHLTCNGIDAGTLNPKETSILHPTLPCGTQVWLVNPSNDAGTLATVVGNNTLFQSKDRLVDMTPATANALGLDPSAPTTHFIAIHALEEGSDPLAILSSPLPKGAHARAEAASATDTLYAAKNGWAEANGGGTAAMAAVVFVTANRADMAFGNHRTIASTVTAPYQFSWTLSPNSVQFPTSGSIGYERWSSWQKTTRDILSDRHSGELLGLQYALGPNATHFYAPKLMHAPKWAASTKMHHIALPSAVETMLGHRFYALRTLPSGLMVASR